MFNLFLLDRDRLRRSKEVERESYLQHYFSASEVPTPASGDQEFEPESLSTVAFALYQEHIAWLFCFSYPANTLQNSSDPQIQY